MRETIEEFFRMFKVEPNEDLIEALVMYVKHECLNAEHRVANRLMSKVDEITGNR